MTLAAALEAYLDRVDRTNDHAAGVVASAEAVASRPWDVVRYAGILARCHLETAEHDLGLKANLDVVPVDSPLAVVKVPASAPFPVLDHTARRSRGAFDTPVDMARRVVQAAMQGATGPIGSALDPACGSGAFLVAVLEAGVKEVYGTDIDPLAVAVARIAAPQAKVTVEDALSGGPQVDLVVGNPPFVPPERQDKALRAALRMRWPWLQGRFDLVVPFAAHAVDRVAPGGLAAMVLPVAVATQPYAAVLRRRWLQKHRFVELSGPHAFPGASVEVMFVVLEKDRGPGPIPVYGTDAAEILRLENAPLSPDLMPGDVELVETIRGLSRPLGSLALVDTGLVAHGPGGSKERLLHDSPGEGRVPYADAREFFAGQRRWLQYTPGRMHRPKQREMFERPKIVIQRLRGRQPVRASIDHDGIYVGHTCTVVQPRSPDCPTLDRLLELLRSPLIEGIIRIERGQRLDLYPRDVASLPVPAAWRHSPQLALHQAWELTPDQVERLMRLARQV